MAHGRPNAEVKGGKRRCEKGRRSVGGGGGGVAKWRRQRPPSAMRSGGRSGAKEKAQEVVWERGCVCYRRAVLCRRTAGCEPIVRKEGEQHGQ